ncbi:hypothetical protein TNCV_3229621 [Trichonephila clavipes]|nr:hypothetical protein TNCV_3229621 [Trichonephila clavipes]
MRGLAARRLFKVSPCREGTIHLQTSMSSPGFKLSSNGTAFSVANHYTGWATVKILIFGSNHVPNIQPNWLQFRRPYGGFSKFLDMSMTSHRASFDQISEFDGGTIVAYRDCGLSFGEVGQRVSRKQATVMRICHRWM